MIVWIASEGRSGNTFFRMVMHSLYGVDTYAAFNASEVLVREGAQDLVGHQPMPAELRSAAAQGEHGAIRRALDDLEASEQLFVFKTHAQATALFGTNYRAILLVRDGRDALASYANYLIDIRFDRFALKQRLAGMAGSGSQLFSPKAWVHLGKIGSVTALKKLGLRHWMVSKRIDQLLQGTSWDWSATNQSWLNREPQPVVVYFDDLVREPVRTVVGAVDALGIGLVAKSNSSLPTFAELKERYPNFFRRGKSGDWRNHFSPAQENRFMAQHGAMMKRLGFTALA